MNSETHLTGSNLRLDVVVPEVRVAGVAFNAALIQTALASLKADDPDWIVFPRLCLTGASCGDLFRQKLLQRRGGAVISVRLQRQRRRRCGREIHPAIPSDV